MRIARFFLIAVGLFFAAEIAAQTAISVPLPGGDVGHGTLYPSQGSGGSSDMLVWSHVQHPDGHTSSLSGFIQWGMFDGTILMIEWFQDGVSLGWVALDTSTGEIYIGQGEAGPSTDQADVMSYYIDDIEDMAGNCGPGHGQECIGW